MYIPSNILLLLEREKTNRKALTESIVLLLCIQILIVLCSAECLCPILVYSPWLLIKSDSGMVILETDMSFSPCVSMEELHCLPSTGS